MWEAHNMSDLALKLAEQRRASAVACERHAYIHGDDTEHGRRYTREARYWRAAVALAEAGDTTSSPVLHQTEDLLTMTIVMVLRQTGGAVECLAMDAFADANTAHEWGRLRAAELQGRA